MRKRTKMTNLLQRRIRELYARGWTYTRIAKELGVSWGTVKYRASDAGAALVRASTERHLAKIKADPERYSAYRTYTREQNRIYRARQKLSKRQRKALLEAAE